MYRKKTPAFVSRFKGEILSYRYRKFHWRWFKEARYASLCLCKKAYLEVGNTPGFLIYLQKYKVPIFNRNNKKNTNFYLF